MSMLSLLANGGVVAAANSNASQAHPAEAKHKRIVSFAPSCTELLQSINASSDIVGVCKFCEQDKLEKDVQIVGDFNSANIERLVKVKPDLILTVNGQEMLSNTLRKNHFSVITFQNTRLVDVSANLKKLGTLVDEQQLADAKSAVFDKSIADLRAITAALKKRTAFFCVWPQPLLTAGRDSFINDAITACGGANVAAGLAAAYPHFSLERLVLANPDVIIMPYEARSEQFLQHQPWISLKAFKQKQVYFLPKVENDRLSRPSVGVIDGLCWLAKCFNPDQTKALDEWLARSKRNLDAAI